MHATSHWHEPLQSICPHASSPVHATSHGPLPHETFSHAGLLGLPVSQVIEQAVASAQLIEAHASAPVHWIVQSYPAGQRTAPHDEAPAPQRIVQVFALTLHASHAGGHVAGRQ